MIYRNPVKIGVISDTHGSVSSLIPEIFKETDLIIHAGDIDKKNVLTKLREIAPVVAVKGNMDFGKWACSLNAAETVTVGKISIYVLHNIDMLDLAPEGLFDIVIYGHTHCAAMEKQNNVLFLNPGSAQYPRYDTNASVALLHINGTSIDVKFVNL